MTYVGWTTEIAQRLKKHNAGTGARTTRGRAWALVHSEKLKTRESAMSREWYLKRDRKLRKMLLDGPHPEERLKAASRRIEAASRFETRGFAALLTMRLVP